MLNIKEIYEHSLLTESKSKHLYENGDVTFKDLRDLMTDVFSNGGIVMQKKVPGMNILLTYKNGDFCVAIDLKKLDKPCCCGKFNDKCCDASKDIKTAFMNTVTDLVEALKQLDPVRLNKYFANGQNYMSCQLVYPPEGHCDDYNDKCFVSLNKLKCYDSNFKEVGEDDASAKELFDALRGNSALCQELSEISDAGIQCLRGCVSGKKVLENVLGKLNQLIDGVGWGCSINSYIQDKYSRYIINKALQHGLDVSRNSAFVNELVSRLSGTKMRPTKSDLITFAKREGLDCRSDAYKGFLVDIESTSDQMSEQIVSPIEDLIYYAVCMAAKNILGYLSISPDVQTQKFLDGIDRSCYDLQEGESDFKWSMDKLDTVKKNLSKINQYAEEHFPADGVVLMYKASPYKVISKLGKLDKLCKLIGC